MVAFLKNIFTEKQINSIGAAALIVSFFGVSSRILGLLRDRLLAGTYGAGDILDVYYTAFRLPDLIFELLIVGSLSAALIPMFSRFYKKGEQERAWRLVQDITIILFGGILICVIIGYIFAPILVHIIAPGFSTEKSDLTVSLARIMFLSPIVLLLSSILGGVLISLKRFVMYASAPLFYNVGIICGIVFIAPAMDSPTGLAWGVVFGAVMHFFVHLIAMRDTGWKFSVPKVESFRSRDARAVIRLMIPRIIGSASHQMSLIAVTFFASLLAAGSLAVFTFAYNIQSVILGLIGVSFALAAFPTLAEAFARDDTKMFNLVLEKTIRRIIYYAIPASMLFWVLRAQLVRIVYGVGEFDWVDTILTVEILSILLISVFAQVLIPLLARAFYAVGDTRTPLWAALVAQCANIILMWLMIQDQELKAIAVAFSVSTIINAAILFIALQARMGGMHFDRVYRAARQIFVASLCAAFVAHVLKTLIGTVLPLDYAWQVLAQLIVAGSSGLAMYLVVSDYFGIKEYETIKKKIIIKIFGRTDVVAQEQHTGIGSN